MNDRMSQIAPKIAVVQGAPSAVVQDLFQSFAERWRPSVRLAGVLAEPEHAPERYQRYLDLGLAIAEGTDVPPNPAMPLRGPIASPAPRRKSSRMTDTWE